MAISFSFILFYFCARARFVRVRNIMRFKNMFEFHPCDRCQYSDASNTFCKKHFNQFKTNERYLTAASKSKIIYISQLCYKFKYMKEKVISFSDIFKQKNPRQLDLF